MTYTIIPENEEITISDPEDEPEFGINPSELLTIYKKRLCLPMGHKTKYNGHTYSIC